VCETNFITPSVGKCPGSKKPVQSQKIASNCSIVTLLILNRFLPVGFVQEFDWFIFYLRLNFIGCTFELYSACEREYPLFKVRKIMLEQRPCTL